MPLVELQHDGLFSSGEHAGDFTPDVVYNLSDGLRPLCDDL